MAIATRQHISSGVSRTCPCSRARYRSRRTRRAGSDHRPTLDGRVSDGMTFLPTPLPFGPPLPMVFPTAQTPVRGVPRRLSHKLDYSPKVLTIGRIDFPRPFV